MKYFSLGVVSLCAFLCGPVRGATIPSLYNTGVASNGSLLSDGAIDPHYSLLTSPAGSGYGPSMFVTLEIGYPIQPGTWFNDGPSSKWISPLANMIVASPPGTYDFQTTFDLTGLDPATAKLIGKWSTDNAGLDILINGTSTGFTNPDGPGSPPSTLSYWQFVPFTITTGFVSGINTLDFVLTNYPPGTDRNPTGLRVELSGTAVPEPKSIFLVASALLGLLSYRARFFCS